MIELRIGSGDINNLLMKPGSKGFNSLVTKFINNEREHYNAGLSGNKYLRTGDIIEKRYSLTRNEFCITQKKFTCIEFNCLSVHVDFAYYDDFGQLYMIEELKSINLPDYGAIKAIFNTFGFNGSQNEIKRLKRKEYAQIQSQMYCTGLEEAYLVFCPVFSYDDNENLNRIITDNDVIKFRVERDEEFISLLKERLQFFQKIKDYYESF